MRVITIIFLAILVSFGSGLSAQTSYNAFKLDYIEWAEWGTDSNQPPNYYEWFYKICGDTLFSGTTYKKVYSATINTTNLPPPYPPPSYGFFGFFRQDSSIKSNYLRLPSMSHDSLLCNYTLQAGDTLKQGHYAHTTCMSGKTIIKIDSLQIGNKKFRILYTDTSVNGGQYIDGVYHSGSFLIEGLGHDYGTMFDYYCMPFEAGVRGINFTFDTICPSHTTMIYQIHRGEIYVAPIPSHDKVAINSRMPIGDINLYDFSGQLILRRSGGGLEIELDIGTLPAGYYFVEVNGRHFKILKDF